MEIFITIPYNPRLERRWQLVLKAYKYGIYPNKEQGMQIIKTFGCCCFVYNKTLAHRKDELVCYICTSMMPVYIIYNHILYPVTDSTYIKVIGKVFLSRV